MITGQTRHSHILKGIVGLYSYQKFSFIQARVSFISYSPPSSQFLVHLRCCMTRSLMCWGSIKTHQKPTNELNLRRSLITFRSLIFLFFKKGLFLQRIVLEGKYQTSSATGTDQEYPTTANTSSNLMSSLKPSNVLTKFPKTKRETSTEIVTGYLLGFM